MPIGKEMMWVSKWHEKPPESRPPGVFCSVLGGWLKPKADCRLVLSVQPFADVIGDYTCQNRDKERCDEIQMTHPLSLPVWGRQLEHYITKNDKAKGTQTVTFVCLFYFATPSRLAEFYIDAALRCFSVSMLKHLNAKTLKCFSVKFWKGGFSW